MTEQVDVRVRLDEIKARADAATEGPWMVDPEDFGTILASNDGGFDGYHIADVHDHDGGMFPVEHNGQFIAHARTDNPAMAAALTAVLDLLDRAEKAANDSPARMFGGAPFPAIIDADAIRTAITEHLGGDRG